jgi:hypothetical protein
MEVIRFDNGELERQVTFTFSFSLRLVQEILIC